MSRVSGGAVPAARWLGIDSSDIDFDTLERPVHRAVVEPLCALRDAAARAGFDLALASGYRDFARQALIWNAKARGERNVHDDRGRPVAVLDLDPAARVETIWRYSALPGTSRHHWGTDIDVYDRAAVAADYRVQLVPAEFAPGGPFHEFSRWLDTRIAQDRAFGFFRPYCAANDVGGIAPEPWHLSFAPLADQYLASLAPGPLTAQLREAGVELGDIVLANLPAWWARFIAAPKTADSG